MITQIYIKKHIPLIFWSSMFTCFAYWSTLLNCNCFSSLLSCCTSEPKIAGMLHIYCWNFLVTCTRTSHLVRLKLWNVQSVLPLLKLLQIYGLPQGFKLGACQHSISLNTWIHDTSTIDICWNFHWPKHPLMVPLLFISWRRIMVHGWKSGGLFSGFCI